MIRLAKYVENELEQNLILFAQAEVRLMASCDYIDQVLLNKELIQLTDEEKKYVIEVRESYSKLKELSSAITVEIQKYKQNYCEVFAD